MDAQNVEFENLQEVFLNVIEADFNNHIEEYNTWESDEYVAPWQIYEEPKK